MDDPAAGNDDRLRCPIDGTELARVEFQGTRVDICRRCGGIWFDRGEIDTVIQGLMAEPARTRRLDRRAGAQPPAPGSGVQRACPRCAGQGLIAEIYGRVSGVEIDKCSGCGGMWVDGGELHALVQFMVGPSQTHSMQALGEALARSVKERENTRALGELGRSMGRRIGFHWLFLPKIIVPLGSTASTLQFPLVTVGLVLLNVLVYAWQHLLAGDPSAVIFSLGLVPARIAEGEGLWGLLTCMFIHGGLFHLLGNLLYLWVFSTPIEDTLGHGRFLGWYLGFGVVANLVFLAGNWGSPIPAVGASGAVSGAMGAYLVFYPHAQIRTFIINQMVDVPAWVYLGVWIGMQLLMAAVTASAGGCACVAFSAHAGGFAAGMAFAWLHKRGARAT